MRGITAYALTTAERLNRVASWRVPPRRRQERRAEWDAELPHIAEDADIRFTLIRALVVVRFAAGNVRGTWLRAPGWRGLLTGARWGMLSGQIIAGIAFLYYMVLALPDMAKSLSGTSMPSSSPSGVSLLPAKAPSHAEHVHAVMAFSCFAATVALGVALGLVTALLNRMRETSS